MSLKVNFKTINKLCFYGYRINNSFLRRLIIKVTLIYDGGEFYSSLIRKIYSYYHDVDIGMYSYGCFNLDNIPRGTKIGRYCSFARNSVLVMGDHPLRLKSLHPFFANPALGFVKQLKIYRPRYEIGHDVWIGTNALILPNAARIGTGAVIGAGSVVTHEVPPFALVAGNPARIIKYRFSEQVRKDIIESRWWERNIDDITKESSYFKTFLNEME